MADVLSMHVTENALKWINLRKDVQHEKKNLNWLGEGTHRQEVLRVPNLNLYIILHDCKPGRLSIHTRVPRRICLVNFVFLEMKTVNVIGVMAQGTTFIPSRKHNLKSG